MAQLKKKKMRTIINCIKRLPRLFKKDNKSRLSVAQVDELIETNKDTFINLGDNLDYDGMGDWGRFPPIKKKKDR